MPKGHFQAPKKPKAGQLARHLGACQLSGRAWGARINSWHAPLGSSFVLNWELLLRVCLERIRYENQGVVVLAKLIVARLAGQISNKKRRQSLHRRIAGFISP